ncbi:MAG: BspA family leucine-rich repeat surface protein [Gammaproteobacteria bacterium]|nr:BspA family leucine-rich repeat surface protein [Acholeplasmataceae bacterium]MCK9529105.1 BspA family leucine-rich repeat surface protein [Gammaproteobacteria bacterium]
MAIIKPPLENDSVVEILNYFKQVLEDDTITSPAEILNRTFDHTQISRVGRESFSKALRALWGALGYAEYLGEYDDIISYQELTERLTTGPTITLNDPEYIDKWLKFNVDDKIIYTTKNFWRSNSWAVVYNKGLIFGADNAGPDLINELTGITYPTRQLRLIAIGDKIYKIRLLKGLDVGQVVNDPNLASGYDVVGTQNSEWNKVFAPLVNDPDLQSYTGEKEADIRINSSLTQEFNSSNDKIIVRGLGVGNNHSISYLDTGYGVSDNRSYILALEETDLEFDVIYKGIKKFNNLSYLDFNTYFDLGHAIYQPEGEIEFHHFLDNGKDYLIPKASPIKITSFPTLYEKGLVYGQDNFGDSAYFIPYPQLKAIPLDGVAYKIRLMKGLNKDHKLFKDNTNPNQPLPNSSDNEFDRFFSIINYDRRTENTYTEPKFANFDFTDLDLANNAKIWMQENGIINTSLKLTRGGLGDDGYLKDWFTNVQYQPLNSAWRPILEPLDYAEFLGEVDSSEVISYSEICNYFNVTQGSLNDTSAGYDKWLKFKLNGKECLVPKVPIRKNISWGHLYDRGLVYGRVDGGAFPTSTGPSYQLRLITINGKKYKVRLIRGLEADNITLKYAVGARFEPAGSIASEWNRLFYPLIPNPNPDDGLETVYFQGPYQANYTNEDLEFGASDGTFPSFNWCMEKHFEDDNYRIGRGEYANASSVSRTGWNQTGVVRGWRPILEECEDNVEFNGELSNLISYEDFSNELGVVEGVLTTKPEIDKWLSFTIDGKELLISKIAIKENISLLDLYNNGLVFGEDDIGFPTTVPVVAEVNQLRTIVLQGKKYKVRLLSCTNLEILSGTTNDSSELQIYYSELARTLFPINSQSTSPLYLGPQIAEYTSEELGFVGTGRNHLALDVYSRDNNRGRTYYRDTIIDWIPSAQNKDHTFGWRAVLERVADDVEFVGEKVFRDENEAIITYTNFSDMLDFTAGTAMGGNSWLELNINGKKHFVAKTPLRYNITYQQLYNAGLVFGTPDNGKQIPSTSIPTNQLRLVELEGKTYKVRLIQGADDNETGILTGLSAGRDIPGTYESEWSRIFYSLISDEVDDKSYTGPRLDLYTSRELGMGTPGSIDIPDLMGTANFVQEFLGAHSLLPDPTLYQYFVYARGYRGPASIDNSRYDLSFTNRGWRPILEEYDYWDTNPLPEDTGPGPRYLVGESEGPGPTQMAGFFGEVAPEDFINGASLASRIGLITGDLINLTEPWLKFYLDGKILFIPKKPIMSDISWDEINACDAVFGNKVLEINGGFYRVRLINGYNEDSGIPYKGGHDSEDTWGTEWNRLIYNVVETNPSYPKNSQYGPNWVTYTENELGTKTGAGRFTWCMEQTELDGEIRKACRGNINTTRLTSQPASYKNANRGWRPVLEKISYWEAFPLPEDTGPGYKHLKYRTLNKEGTRGAGFFGEVQVTDLIDGADLATQMGLTAGVAINTDSNWLKFYLDGKIMYVAKKNFRTNLSWIDLENAGLTGSGRVVEVAEQQYKSRLLSGRNPDPTVVQESGYDVLCTHNSEWNRLMYNVADSSPILPERFKQSQIGKNWRNFTPDADLDIFSYSKDGRTGSYSWCRETNLTNDTLAVLRGRFDTTYIVPTATKSSSGESNRGWRPALEKLDLPSDLGVGPTTLIGHEVGPRADMISGFFGEVENELLITPEDLIEELEFVEGLPSNLDTSWLKFISDGNIIYTTKKPISISVSRNYLDSLNLINGKRIIQIKDRFYRIRLLGGVSPDYTTISGGYDPVMTYNSEWNRLIYPITKANPSYPKLSQTSGNWEQYEQVDLGLGVGSGSGTITRDVFYYAPTSIYHLVHRGHTDVTYLSSASVSLTGNNTLGWRPVLELIDEKDIELIIDKAIEENDLEVLKIFSTQLKYTVTPQALAGNNSVVEISQNDIIYFWEDEGILHQTDSIYMSGEEGSERTLFIVKAINRAATPSTLYLNAGWRANLINIGLKEVTSWGFIKWNRVRVGSNILTKVPNYLPRSVTSLAGVLSSSVILTGEELQFWDVSNVNTLISAFQECRQLRANLANWNISNVTSLENTFHSTWNMNFDFSHWNTGNVITMQNMLHNSRAMVGTGMEHLDVSKVTNMDGFLGGGYSKVFNTDLSGWCVTLIPNEPTTFASTTPAWVLPKPVWGTCPNG